MLTGPPYRALLAGNISLSVGAAAWGAPSQARRSGLAWPSHQKLQGHACVSAGTVAFGVVLRQVQEIWDCSDLGFLRQYTVQT